MIQLSALKEQPRQLRILFFAEMWERFSYYGMRALLVLYMTKFFNFSDEKSFGIYGAYGALVYGSPILGGYLADRYLGFRYSVIFGACLMIAGHALMSISQPEYFFTALALISLGVGFFKPNVSSLVGELYGSGDSRRDNGFIIFYMGINLGALGQGIFGLLGERVGWHWGFGLAAIGMMAGLVVFYIGQSSFGDRGLPPKPEWLKQPGFLGIKNLQLILIGSVIIVPVYVYLLMNNEILKYLLSSLGIVSLVYILYQAFLIDKVGRQKLFAALVLIFFSVLFWALFEQAGSSISLFTDRNVDRNLFGFNVPASAFQSVNAFFIVTLVPIFAFLWSFLAKSNKEPGIPVKFVLALIQVGLGFVVMGMGKYFADGQGLVPISFLIIGYLLHTTGELCLSPVGLSMITKLSPSHMTSMMMGTWFLAISFAHYIAGGLAKLTSIKSGELASGLQSLAIYSENFITVGGVCMVSSLILAAMVPLLFKWMHGVK